MRLCNVHGVICADDHLMIAVSIFGSAGAMAAFTRLRVLVDKDRILLILATCVERWQKITVSVVKAVWS